MTTDRLRYLLDRCTAQFASAEERAELRQGLLAHDAGEIDSLLSGMLIPDAPKSIDAARSAAILESILASTKVETDKDSGEKTIRPVCSTP